MKTLLRYCFILISILTYANVSAKAVTLSGAGSDATLKSIVLSTATTLVYSSTGSSNFNYTTSVSAGTSSLSIQATVNDPGATFTINGASATSGQFSSPITLNVNGTGSTIINIIVTATDGVTKYSYGITVNQSGSNNAFLSSLSVSTGSALVSSATGPGNYNYTTSVTVGTSSLTVTPITADPTATVTIIANGNTYPVTSGNASGSIPLNSALNATTTINVQVTAQDGVTKQTYSITVTEAGSNNAILSSLSVSTHTALVSISGTSNFNYNTSVKSTVTSIQVMPTAADPNATITINGNPASSGVYSSPITLLPGSTSIYLVVTAQDGVTQQTYSITVLPNGTSGTSSSIVLSANSSLVPSGTNSYITDVDPNVSSLTVTPTVNAKTSAGATITVNGVAVTSGTASGSITLNAVGTPTVITIAVTSQDGSTTTTTNITVNRNGSNNYNLSSIALSTNTSLVLVSQSASNVNYQTSIPSSVGSLTVTATAADPVNAFITVNGTQVTSGQPSGSITIPSGGTTITIVVKAQDGSTQTTSIKVLTNGSNNANLSSIVLSTSSALTLTSSSTTNTNYTTSVSPGITSLTVTPTAQDPNATITITANGTTTLINSGTASGPITLAAIGSTTSVILTVKSPGGTVTKTTSITISRNGSNNANSSFSLSTKTLTLQTTGIYNVNYTSSVSPHTLSLTVTVVTLDPNATITVNGFATVSGVPSSPVTLNNGSTLILIQVTAQDGVTTRTTGITINRSGTLYVWTGTGTTSAFNNSGNWNPSNVPAAGDVVSFGETAYTGFQPVITGTTTIGEVYFGSANATTLTIPTSANNYFTIVTGLTINQGATAAISSSAGSPANINIGSGATVNFAGTGTGVLTISPFVNFTLQSTAAGSASVGQITTSSIVGKVSVERYISGGSSVYRGYRLLSSPVYQSAANGNKIYSLNYVQASSLVTGAGGTANGFDSSPLNNPSLLLYREDQVPPNSYSSGNYWGISKFNNSPAYNYNVIGGSTVNVPVGNGFDFFFRGDRINNLANKYISSTVAESVTMVTTGTLNAGPITVHDWFTPTSANLSYTNNIANGAARGFNLVGNPYASSIDWDTYNTTTPGTGIYAPNVGNSVYIIDPVSKNYGVYMANSGLPPSNNATHIIPSGQGFFVVAQSTGASLTFNEDAKTTVQVTGPNLLLGKPVANDVIQYLHLKLSQKQGQDSVQADEVYIRFNNRASSNFLINEDAAQKPGFGIASLASMSSDGVPLSINSLKLPQQSAAIALKVNAVTDGAYQLSMPDVKSIPALFDIWLIDAYKKDSVDIRNNPAYSFNINNSDSASYGSKRFSLVMRQNPALALRLLNFTATKVTNGAQIVWKTVNEENYTNFTVQRSTDDGKTFDVLDGFLSNNQGTYSYLDKAPSMAPNQYRLKLEDFNGNISYSQVITLSYSNLSNSLTIKTISVYPNPASTVINLAIAQNSSSTSNSSVLQTADLIQTNNSGPLYDIKIISISGTVIKTVTSSQPNWQGNVSNLLPGTYIITVQNSNDKSLVGKNMFVKL
ncbi:MAG: Cadherin-like beta sandwich domain protein [Mucilaginibacter sp.]|nr:Cadherin-like beta sandwich domain protein [Mucilaginibacter sp.]